MLRHRRRRAGRVRGFFIYLMRRARLPTARPRPPIGPADLGATTSGCQRAGGDRVNAELAGAAGCGVDARRRDRSHDRPRALADAGAVRRLGRVFRVRAVPLPAQAPTRRPTTPARRANSRSRTEVAVAIVEVVAAPLLRHSGLGDARQAVPGGERSDRRARRRRAVRVERALSRPRRQVRPHRRQAGVRRQSARPRSDRSERQGRHHRRSTS